MGFGSGIRDLSSGILKNPIPDPVPRVKKALYPGSGPQHWIVLNIVLEWDIFESKVCG